MYAMKSEDLKGRGKVRTHSGLFSMGALAIALSACGSGFDLAEENGAVVDGADVKLTFTDAPKTVSAKVTDYKITPTGLTSVTGVKLTNVGANDKVVTFTFEGQSDNIKIELETEGAFKDHNDGNYALNVTIDNRPPRIESVVVDVNTNTAVVTFDEKISAVVATKFSIDSVAATGAAIGGSGGDVVTFTFASLTTSAGLGLAAVGAVTDDVSDKANSAGNQNLVGFKSVTFSGSTDTTPPVLASTDPVVVNKTAKTITVDFDETITTKVDANITVSYDADGAGTTSNKTTLTLTTDYTIAVTNGDVVITLAKTDALTTGGVYSVAFAANAVTDSDDNKNGIIADTAAPAVASLEDDLVGLSLGSSDADYGF